jgi:hypothetical protein
MGLPFADATLGRNRFYKWPEFKPDIRAAQLSPVSDLSGRCNAATAPSTAHLTLWKVARAVPLPPADH